MSLSGRAGSKLRTTFLSLRNRNFRLFFIGNLISNTGNWLTNVALTLLVLSLTDNGLAIGILAACQYGPVFFLSAWAGAVADRSDKRRFLFITQSLSMVQSFALAFWHSCQIRRCRRSMYWPSWAASCSSFDNPLRRSFVPEMVRQDDIANAVVLNSLVDQHLAHLRPDARRSADCHPWLWLVLHHRRVLVSGRACFASS